MTRATRLPRRSASVLPVLAPPTLAFLLAAAVVAGAGCSSTHTVDEDANNGIYGAWSSTSTRLQLTSDGSYTLTRLTATSATTANARAETGTFTGTTGTLTWTPAESSCSGAAPRYQSAYELGSGTLTVALPSGVVDLAPEDEDPVRAGAVLTLGCYESDGTFTAAPLAPVMPVAPVSG